jgi:ketosteroid isomerase-like protein
VDVPPLGPKRLSRPGASQPCQTLRMSVQEVAEGLVALCKEGRFRDAIETYYSDEIVSVEAGGEPRQVHGLDAVRAKQDWFAENMEIHGCTVEGPWVNEPFFAAKIVVEVTDKASGQRTEMSEIAVYEVRDGKIVHERFF